VDLNGEEEKNVLPPTRGGRTKKVDPWKRTKTDAGTVLKKCCQNVLSLKASLRGVNSVVTNGENNQPTLRKREPAAGNRVSKKGEIWDKRSGPTNAETERMPVNRTPLEEKS